MSTPEQTCGFPRLLEGYVFCKVPWPAWVTRVYTGILVVLAKHIGVCGMKKMLSSQLNSRCSGDRLDGKRSIHNVAHEHVFRVEGSFHIVPTTANIPAPLKSSGKCAFQVKVLQT